MPRTAAVTKLDGKAAAASSSMLLASGNELTELLLSTGILYPMSSEEEQHLGVAFLKERERITAPQRKAEFKRFSQGLGMSEDMSCDKYLFSFKQFRAHFLDIVHVLRDHPANADDGWGWLRCSCTPFSQFAGCEHIEYTKTLPVPRMKDKPNSSECIYDKPAKTGRRPGSYTTARGKAKASTIKAKSKTSTRSDN